jgi:hypothetical protein
MRAGSAWTSGLALTLTLVAGTGVSTHQRDEYLQAARIALQPDAIDIELDLTPGIAVADAFIAMVDGNRDGVLSADEQQRYANQVLSALVIALDTRPITAQLMSSTFPDPGAVRRGEGSVRLRARAALPRVSTGAHQLLFRNLHLPGVSAYLANALAPESARVAVTGQRRISDQSELTIEYTLRADPAVARAGLVVSLAVAAILIVPAARRFRAT